MANIIADLDIIGSLASNNPAVSPNPIDSLIYDSTGAVIGAARIDSTIPTETLVAIADPAVPEVLVVEIADPTMPTETPVEIADPTMPTETPVEIVDPTMPTETPVEIADPTMPTETPVEIVDPTMPTKTPVEIADPTMPTKTPVEIVDPTIPLIVQNLVPTPQPSDNSGLLSYAFSNIVLTNNFFTTTAASGFGISAVSQKAGGKVSEIGIFAVDDVTGKIGGIAPGAAGYLQAIGNSARSIFSALGGNFFDPSNKREITLEPNKVYGFFEVQDGSIAELQKQLISGKVPTNILSSVPEDKGNVAIQITKNSVTGGYNVSVNNDELVLSVVKLNGAMPNVAIGAKSQGLAQGRTIDLTDLTGTLKADITTTSSAAFKNNIGFYVVEDSIGTIRLADGVTTLKPNDVGYAAEAIKNAILQTGKTDSKIGQDLTGGKIYAPVVVSQGSFDEFIANNSKNVGGNNAINAYFNYVGANSDGKDHFRLIGDNTFGVEDQYGGGDRDFNDLVVNVKVK
jgi:Domain of unknown function (DUF4114)